MQTLKLCSLFSNDLYLRKFRNSQVQLNFPKPNRFPDHKLLFLFQLCPFSSFALHSGVTYLLVFFLNGQHHYVIVCGGQKGARQGFQISQLFGNGEIWSYFFVCFPKLVICSCVLEIIPSQDNAITWLIIRSFATNITTGLIFSSS